MNHSRSDEPIVTLLALAIVAVLAVAALHWLGVETGIPGWFACGVAGLFSDPRIGEVLIWAFVTALILTVVGFRRTGISLLLVAGIGWAGAGELARATGPSCGLAQPSGNP